MKYIQNVINMQKSMMFQNEEKYETPNWCIWFTSSKKKPIEVNRQIHKHLHCVALLFE